MVLEDVGLPAGGSSEVPIRSSVAPLDTSSPDCGRRATLPRSICSGVFYPFTGGAVQHAIRRSDVREPAEPTGEDAVDAPEWDTALRTCRNATTQPQSQGIVPSSPAFVSRYSTSARTSGSSTGLVKDTVWLRSGLDSPRTCKLLIPVATARARAVSSMRALPEQIYQALVVCLRQREMDF